MLIKYNINIDEKNIEKVFIRLINLIYKLLPTREEGIEWENLLTTIIEELSGLSRLFIDQQDTLLIILSKLEGLYILTDENKFFIFRRTIFEILNLLNEVKTKCLQKI